MLRQVKASRVLYAHRLASMRTESSRFGRSAMLSDGDVVVAGATVVGNLGTLIVPNLPCCAGTRATPIDLKTMVAEQSCEPVNLCNPATRPADGDALVAMLRGRRQKPVFWQGSGMARATMSSRGRGILLTGAAMSGRAGSASWTSRGLGPAGQDFGAAKLPFKRSYCNSSDRADSPESIPALPKSLLAVENFNRSTATRPFDIHTGVSEDLEEATRLDILRCNEELSLETLKEIYYRDVEPALVRRGLISPFAIGDKRAAQLHYEYQRLLRARELPYVTTLFDVMRMYETLDKDLRCSFLNRLNLEKAIVLNDWRSIGSSVGYTVYDHGVMHAPYGSSPKYHSGETDASFCDNEKKADIGNLIWLGNQVVDGHLFFDFQCSDSIQAEAMGVLCLQKRAKALDIEAFQISTDNAFVARVSSGTSPPDDHKHKDLLQLIQRNRAGFKFFQTRWVPREKLVFVDDLIRLGKGGLFQSRFAMPTILRRWAPFLNGAPIFHLNNRNKNVYKGFVNGQGNKNKLILKDIEKNCYIEVEECNKIEGMWHVLVALRPATTVLIVLKDKSLIAGIEDQLKNLYFDCSIEYDTTDNYMMLHCSINHSGDYLKRSKRPLIIILDPSMHALSNGNSLSDLEDKKNYFTAFISSPCDKQIINDIKCPPLSPVSFVSYHNSS